MRVRANIRILATVTASVAVSAVAAGQVSTWGASSGPTPAPSAAASASDAEVESATDAALSDASTTVSDTGSPARPAEANDAGDASSDDASGGYSPSDVGFSFGLRVGYGIPFGNAAGTPLNNVVFGMIPIGVDAGWFFNPHLYAGVYLYYGFGLAAGLGIDTCGEDESGCSAKTVRVGALVHWHFNPSGLLDPWIGGGLGYEALLLSSSNPETIDANQSSGIYGIAATLEGGLDLKPLKYMGLGPYVELAAGPYVADSQGDALFQMHGWLTFGVRARTNL